MAIGSRFRLSLAQPVSLLCVDIVNGDGLNDRY